MADIITTLHPEGFPLDNLYPNIKKENLPSNLQPVADFALSEYQKTLNLWDEAWEVGVFNINTGEPQASSNTIRTKNLIKVIGGEQYYAYSGANRDMWCFFYDESKNLIENVGTSQYPNAKQIKNSVFTTPNNCVYIKFYLVAYGATYNHDITISKGSQSVGYLSFNGRILHEIDGEGVLLWGNGNADIAFPETNITMANSSGYKYLAILLKHEIGGEYGVYEVVKLVNAPGLQTISTARNDTAILTVTRLINVNANNINLRFYPAYRYDTEPRVANEYCVPVAIYGIK